jgi:acyl-CoA reductase-like NAD-dependent aldehyde dehydrogenase
VATPPAVLGITVGSHHGEDTRPPITGEQIAARDAAQREESERVIADYAARQHERQEREAKQAREVFERQIAERNRANGW